MQKRLLIIGCGISGICLSWECIKNKIDFKIIDPFQNNSCSAIAGALINPISGRKYQLQWNIKTLLIKAESTYSELEHVLHIPIIESKPLIKIHQSEIGKKEWQEKRQSNPEITAYISEDFDTKFFENLFYCSHGALIIDQVKTIHATSLINSYGQYLEAENKSIKANFNWQEFNMNENTFEYKNEFFTDVIFCDGVQALNNYYFQWLPFKPAKGECFILEIKNLPQTFFYNKKIILIPLGKDQFWAGATNSWNDLTTDITQKGKEELMQALNQCIKIPYTIIAHHAQIRPSIKDRTPVIGAHPHVKNMYILNGMGTKGFSLAPYYGQILLQHILTKQEIPSQVNVRRFAHLVSTK